jgi:hypothetical protein
MPIEQFGANIYIRGNRSYCTSVSAVLTSMMVYQTGHAAISEIWSIAGRRLTIRPFGSDEENALTHPISWRGAVPRGEPPRDRSGAVIHREGVSGTGRGSGTSTIIRYSPSAWADISEIRSVALGIGVDRPVTSPLRDQAEVLLHEISHAIRNMRGLRGSRAIANPPATSPIPQGLENEEELFAITVANIFSSERGRTLRGGHRPMTELAHPDFWREPAIYTFMQDYIRALPAFTGRLERIDTAFNPFRSIRNGVGPNAP